MGNAMGRGVARQVANIVGALRPGAAMRAPPENASG